MTDPRYHHQYMTAQQPRTDATSRDRSPDHQYTLSIDQAAELYADAGHPRTPRAIQKYCALSKLDCHKVETETGEKYLVAPYSVERHIGYINEVRTVTNGRDQTRPDANVRPLEIKDEQPRTGAANKPEESRTDATIRGVEERYVLRLEEENLFLRGQIGRKDEQISALLERDRESNLLVAGLQRILGPLLQSPKQEDSKEQHGPTAGMHSEDGVHSG